MFAQMNTFFCCLETLPIWGRFKPKVSFLIFSFAHVGLHPSESGLLGTRPSSSLLWGPQKAWAVSVRLVVFYIPSQSVTVWRISWYVRFPSLPSHLLKLWADSCPRENLVSFLNNQTGYPGLWELSHFPTISVMHIKSSLCTVEGHQMKFEQIGNMRSCWLGTIPHHKNVNSPFVYKLISID